MFNIERSPLDEARFALRVAKVILTEPEDIAILLEQACQENLNLLILRCPADQLNIVHAVEKNGFQLMDTLIYYRFALPTSEPALEDAGITVRPWLPADTAQVVEVAGAAFRNYCGHYHADPLLPRQQCDQVYISWAQRACTESGVADQVLAAEQDGQVVGFAVLKRLDEIIADGVLFAVHPEHQRQGILKRLLLGALGWSQAAGCKEMWYSTQIINYAAQRVLVRLGFEPLKVIYTFHRWF